MVALDLKEPNSIHYVLQELSIIIIIMIILIIMSFLTACVKISII